MSDPKTPFEVRLSEVPRAPLDPSWRADILGAAVASSRRQPQRNWFGNWAWTWTWTWTWAWSAVAATWVVILGLNQAAGTLTPSAQLPSWGPDAQASLAAQVEARRRLLSAVLEDPSINGVAAPRAPRPGQLSPRGELRLPGLGQREQRCPRVLA